MSDSIDLRPELEGWADNMLMLFDRKIRELDIHQGQLLNSLAAHIVWHSGGDVNKIRFAFNYYGRFVDAGVGRGVLLADRDALVLGGKTNRRKKPWFTSVFYREIPGLRRLIEIRLGNTLPLIITRNIEDNADLGHTPMEV